MTKKIERKRRPKIRQARIGPAEIERRISAGPGPRHYDVTDGSEGKIALIGVLNWHSTYFNPGDLVDEVVKYMGNSDQFSRDDVANFSRCPTHVLDSGPMTSCRMMNLGSTFDVDYVERIHQKIREYVDRGRREASKKTAEDGEDAVRVRRTAARAGTLIAYLEGELDKFYLSEYRAEPNKFFEYLLGEEATKSQGTMISDYYSPLLEEINAVAKARRGSSEREGYEHLSVTQVKKYQEFVAAIVAAGDKVAADKRRMVVKRQSKAKTVTAERLVKNVRYLKFSKDLQLGSVDPTKLIGATMVVVFNVKYRTLGVYRASTPMTVKGTTLVGFDPSTSLGKRIRRPETEVGKIISSAKNQLIKDFDVIKTSPFKLNGRLNDDVLILRTAA